MLGVEATAPRKLSTMLFVGHTDARSVAIGIKRNENAHNSRSAILANS